jgi:hypothetical protein
MGVYVNGCLLPGEQVIAEARPHWAIFIGPELLVLLGLMMDRVGNIVGLIGAVWGSYRLLVYWTTELAVTNKRVIAKGSFAAT